MNEILMRRIYNQLTNAPLTVATIVLRVNEHPRAVRPLLAELERQGKIEKLYRAGTLHYWSTERYKNGNGNSPGPEAA